MDHVGRLLVQHHRLCVAGLLYRHSPDLLQETQAHRRLPLRRLIHVPRTGNTAPGGHRHGPGTQPGCARLLQPVRPQKFLHDDSVPAHRQYSDNVRAEFCRHHGHHDDSLFHRRAADLPGHRTGTGREHRYDGHVEPRCTDCQHAGPAGGDGAHGVQRLRRHLGAVRLPSFHQYGLQLGRLRCRYAEDRRRLCRQRRQAELRAGRLPYDVQCHEHAHPRRTYQVPGEARLQDHQAEGQQRRGRIPSALHTGGHHEDPGAICAGGFQGDKVVRRAHPAYVRHGARASRRARYGEIQQALHAY